MEQKVFTFGEKYINKNKFHMHGKSINVNEVDIKKVLLSNKVLNVNKGSYKYCTGL